MITPDAASSITISLKKPRRRRRAVGDANIMDAISRRAGLAARCRTAGGTPRTQARSLPSISTAQARAIIGPGRQHADDKRSASIVDAAAWLVAYIARA